MTRKEYDGIDRIAKSTKNNEGQAEIKAEGDGEVCVKADIEDTA